MQLSKEVLPEVVSRSTSHPPSFLVCDWLSWESDPFDPFESSLLRSGLERSKRPSFDFHSFCPSFSFLLSMGLFLALAVAR